MKNLKFISLMMGCLAAMCVTFTSCDDDDDNNRGLTPQEQQTAFTAVRGSYSGTLSYDVPDSATHKAKADSTTVSWEINSDSVMTIKNFPMSVIAKSIKDSTIAKAFEALPPQDLKCYIGFFRVNPATFLINPVGPTLNLTYGGKTHSVRIQFYGNTYYSFGVLNGKNLLMQIAIGRILEDGNQANWSNGIVPYYVFKAKK